MPRNGVLSREQQASLPYHSKHYGERSYRQSSGALPSARVIGANPVEINAAKSTAILHSEKTRTSLWSSGHVKLVKPTCQRLSLFGGSVQDAGAQHGLQQSLWRGAWSFRSIRSMPRRFCLCPPAAACGDRCAIL